MVVLVLKVATFTEDRGGCAFWALNHHQPWHGGVALLAWATRLSILEDASSILVTVTAFYVLYYNYWKVRRHGIMVVHNPLKVAGTGSNPVVVTK